jgi:hypothetical protein
LRTKAGGSLILTKATIKRCSKNDSAYGDEMNIPDISWARLFIQASAVVLSILLAFSIDAAWQQRQEREADITQLKGLYGELQSHKVLLAEAISAHRNTVEYGYELLALISAEPTAGNAARITKLLDGLMDFYRINAPFGSLETAISSGTIARMRNIELSSQLASWPTAIEDLMEEQETSSIIISVELYAKLGRMVSLRDVYGKRFSSPSGRGTGQIIAEVAMPELPDTLAPPDYSTLHGDTSLANDLMYLMMMAQSSQGEATLADRKLDNLMEKLAACLAERDC